eukprot:212019-Pyramimonas_sp.AAC.2
MLYYISRGRTHLRGVLAGPVARVDERRFHDARGFLGGAGGVVAQHDHVRVALHRPHRVCACQPVPARVTLGTTAISTRRDSRNACVVWSGTTQRYDVMPTW